MDLPPGAHVASDVPLTQAGLLRRAWFEVAAATAPQLADLPVLLDARLADLEAAGMLDEPSLLAIAEDASQHAMEQGAGDVARSLSKKLRRAIYEFLLALDAVNPAELANAPAVPPATSYVPVAPAAAPAVVEPVAAEPAVTIAPADVSGADDAPTAAQVPLWEQVVRPEPVREVYRVGSRDLETPAVEEHAPLADLIAEDAAEIAELVREISDGDAEAAAETEAAVEEEPLEPLGVVIDAAELFELAHDHSDEIAAEYAEAWEAEAAVIEEVAEAEVELAAEPEAETVTEPVAAEPEAETVSEPVAAEPVAEAVTEPVAEHVEPAETAATAGDPPVETIPNGVKPHRDLLRVPRQFRRLPPLAGHRDEPLQPAAHADTSLVAWTVPADAAPAPAPAPVIDPAPAIDDDDASGVPALPWPLDAAETAPPVEPEAPAAPEFEPEPEEDMGVPFSPLAEAQTLAPEPPPDWAPAPAAPATPFPIAPREGFHLTDPGALDAALAAADTLTPPPAPPAAEANPFTAAVPPVNVPPTVSVAQPAPAAPQHEQAEADDAGAWRVRQSPRAQLLAERMAQKRREEAARAALEAASIHTDDHGGKKRRRGEDALPDVGTARRQLDEHLRKKRGAEAAALLQRLAQEMGGRDIADLALDSGDRCRALGQSRSATNCYLAAWRADPLYETPLWRLSDVCLNDQEIDLAVGYLERIADLMRSRGDDEGAIGVYRKIAMIAPERQDVRDVIRLAKTTGRLDV
jgi:hypothetical protein